ncbi:MAG: hypothetical protein IPJ71_18810 [Bdellovibrionales bacterium]|nr:hypothetical protein [Bdellovibrionales bacterium]
MIKMDFVLVPFVLMVCLVGLTSCRCSKPFIPENVLIEFANHDLYVEGSDQTSILAGSNFTTRFQGSDSRLKVSQTHNIDEADAETRARDRIYFVTSLYRTQVSPYPDRLSNIISCESLPVTDSREIAGGWVKRVQLWANERYTFGSCEKGQQTQLALVVMVYCKEKKAYLDLEYFLGDKDHTEANLSRANAFEASIKCR